MSTSNSHALLLAVVETKRQVKSFSAERQPFLFAYQSYRSGENKESLNRMKLSSVSFFTAHLVFFSVKADESSSLVSDTQCSTAAADKEHCYNDKSNTGGLDETQDENVSIVSTTVQESSRISTATTGEALYEESSSCGAYLAASTIPNAGLGVFTARTISAGEMVLNTEPVIHMEDVNLHTHRRLRHDQLPDSSETPWLLSDFWLSSFSTMGSYEAADVKSVVPGLVSACNYHPGLDRSMQRMPPHIKVESPLHRSRDPGAGASTTHHGTYLMRQSKSVSS